MKNGKVPTRRQKILMEDHGLDPERYLVVKNTVEYMEVVSRESLKRQLFPATRKLWKTGC
jgi:hypothetical protein